MNQFSKFLFLILLALPGRAGDIKGVNEGERATLPQALPKTELPLAAAITAPNLAPQTILQNPALQPLNLEVPGPQAAVPVLPQAELPAAVHQPSAASTSEGSDPTAGAPTMGAALDTRFDELVSAFGHKRDTTAEGNSPVDDASREQIISRVRQSVLGQVLAMRHTEPEDGPVLKQVVSESGRLLDGIDKLMAKGEIDPRATLRASETDPIAPPSKRELRVGVYPVAADPFQWGHLLIALRAVEAFRLDKVIFVLAGDDPRKPNMTKADFRHPMGQAVLEKFAPFFQYSSIAVGTQYDGETNIFRILRLNPEQKMQAFYLVGGDHYRLKDKNGNPDTLPKLETKIKDPQLGFDGSLHAVKAVFIKREGSDEHVPTTIDTYFLPEVPFDASSTLVREGNHALMPYAAYQYAKEHRPGLYNIPPNPKKP